MIDLQNMILYLQLCSLAAYTVYSHRIEPSIYTCIVAPKTACQADHHTSMQHRASDCVRLDWQDVRTMSNATSPNNSTAHCRSKPIGERKELKSIPRIHENRMRTQRHILHFIHITQGHFRGFRLLDVACFCFSQAACAFFLSASRARW